MVLTGLASLKYLNIPMFNTLRRLTTLFTMFGESYLLGAKNSISVQASVWLMIVGAIVAGLADFDYSPIGYALVFANCAFTAMYLLYIAKLGKSSNMNTFGMMYVNNIQSLPLIIIICIVNGDFAAGELPSYSYLFDYDFIACFLFQSGLAFLLNYSIFLCTNVNSALATSVTGQIKNIATTAVGYFSFGDVTYSVWNVIGLVLGVLSSVGYSGLKYVESEAKNKYKGGKEESVAKAEVDEEDQSLLERRINEEDNGTDIKMTTAILSHEVAASSLAVISSYPLSSTSSSSSSSSLPIALGPSSYHLSSSSSSSSFASSLLPASPSSIMPTTSRRQ